MDYQSLSPEQFIETLRGLGQRRAYLVHQGAGRMKVSHDALQPLARQLVESFSDFRQHEAIFFELSPATGALFAAFLHKTKRGQGAGGVRHWPYATLGDLIRDGLRLSLGMGRKNALAGLWWGGGKGIIARPDGDRYRDPEYRRPLYQDYGAFITSLRGAYVTAEDAGTDATDMAEIFRTTRFVTCIPTEVGGSGNPSIATATGVLSAMEAALEWSGLGTLSGKTVAMQGLGNVGISMLEQLLERGVGAVIACDISEARVARARKRFHGRSIEIEHVDKSDTAIFACKCDVFAPNALGAILNPKTIPLLNTRIVCGAANNQLADDRRDDRALHERGIVHVPDFVANRMGIVHCANEQYGTIPGDPYIMRHLGREWENSIALVTQRILNRAREQAITPTRAANELADELSEELHPIWGHRSRLIVESLMRDSWHSEA